MILILSVSPALPAEINLDKLPIAKTKLDFLSLYKTQWELFGLSRRLKQAVNEAFDEQTDGLLWGTVRIQLTTNYDNIREKIQKATEFKFTVSYDKFIAEFEDTWEEKLRENIVDFYKRQNELLYFELSANPMAQAYLRQDYDRITEDNGLTVMKKISDKLSDKYNIPDGTVAKLIGGGLILLARKQLTKYVTQIVARKFAGTAVGKLAGSAVPVIGWAMLAWSAWDIYSMLTGIEDTIKETIFNSYNTMYTEDVPLIYWEGMESYVKDAYIFTYESLLMMNVNKGKELANNSLIKDLSRNLTKSEQRFFADRIAVIQDIADDKKYTLDNVLDKYGELIRDAKRKDFDHFTALLIETEELPKSYPPEPEIIISHDISPDIKSADVKQNTPAPKIYEGH